MKYLGLLASVFLIFLGDIPILIELRGKTVSRLFFFLMMPCIEPNTYVYPEAKANSLAFFGTNP